MTPVNPATTIPKGLKNYLPESESPWQMSAPLFARVSQQPFEAGGTFYKKCQVLPEDPECRFILNAMCNFPSENSHIALTYFNHQKPAKYGISKIFCIQTPTLTNKFTADIPGIDVHASTFKPQWDQHESLDQRKQVIQRWKEQTNEFYPISIKRKSRTDTYFNVRVLPLWHGTSGAICHSIASAGFTFFGKHHFFTPNAIPGALPSTDAGYFGNSSSIFTANVSASEFQELEALLKKAA